jgi:hypothetical protein
MVAGLACGQMGQEPTAEGPGKVVDIVHPCQIPYVAVDPTVATMRIDWTVKPEQFTTYTRDTLIAWVKAGHRVLLHNECVELFGGKVSRGDAVALTLLPDSHPLTAGVRQLAMDCTRVSEGDLPPGMNPYVAEILALAPFLEVGPSVEVLVRSAQPHEQRSFLAAAFVYPLEQGEVLFWHRCFDYGRFDGPTLKQNFDGYITTFPNDTQPPPFELLPATCPGCQTQFPRDLQERLPGHDPAQPGKMVSLTDAAQLKALIADPEVASLQVAPSLAPDQFPTESRDALILWVNSGHRVFGSGPAMGLLGLATDRVGAPLVGLPPYRCVVKVPDDYHPIVTGVRRVQLQETTAEVVRVPASAPALVAPAGGGGAGNYLRWSDPGYVAMLALMRLGEGEVLYCSPHIDLGSLDGPILKRNCAAYLRTFPQPRLQPDEELCPDCGSVVKL